MSHDQQAVFLPVTGAQKEAILSLASEIARPSSSCRFRSPTAENTCTSGREFPREIPEGTKAVPVHWFRECRVVDRVFLRPPSAPACDARGGDRLHSPGLADDDAATPRRPLVHRSLAGAAAGFSFARERVRNWADFDNAFAANCPDRRARPRSCCRFVMAAGTGGAIQPGCRTLPALLVRHRQAWPSSGPSVRSADCGWMRMQTWSGVRLARPAGARRGNPAGRAVHLSGRPRADNAGLASFVPTTVLVAGMYSLPRFGARLGQFHDTETLTARLTDTRTANWQRSGLAKPSGPSTRPPAARISSGQRPCSTAAATTVNSSSTTGGAIRLALQAGPGRRRSSQLPLRLLHPLAQRFIWPTASRARDAASPPTNCAPSFPDLLAHFQNATPHPEWWATLQLLAPLRRFLPRTAPLSRKDALFPDENATPPARAAVVLAAIFRPLARCYSASSPIFGSMDSAEQIRLLTFLARNPASDAALHDLFRAMVAFTRPFLEVIQRGRPGFVSPQPDAKAWPKLLMIFESRMAGQYRCLVSLPSDRPHSRRRCFRRTSRTRIRKPPSAAVPMGRAMMTVSQTVAHAGTLPSRPSLICSQTSQIDDRQPENLDDPFHRLTSGRLALVGGHPLEAFRRRNPLAGGE